jgi:hypothetical protein
MVGHGFRAPHENKSAMDASTLVRRTNKQQVKRNDSGCSVVVSAIHCVTDCATMIGLLIASCELPAARSVAMNNLASCQMSLCHFCHYGRLKKRLRAAWKISSFHAHRSEQAKYDRSGRFKD